MEFTGLTSASHMSLPEAGYGSEEGYVGSEISGAVSGVATPGASRLQASQSQQRSTTMQRLQALALTLATPVVKGLIHIPLNQIQLLFCEGVLRFSDVNRGNRKALPPWLCYDAVDTHEIRGVGLIKAPIHIVEIRRPSLGWHGLSLSVLIDTLSSR